MADVQKLADAAEVIVQGYAFIDRGEGVTVINLHKPDHAAYFYNHELVETNMDDIEAYKVNKLYQANVKYMEEDGKKYGYNLLRCPHKYFFVEQFFQTEYKKTSYGGVRFVKVFDLNKLLGIDELPSTEEIANILAEKTWE